uniref:Uncharacterized protein n=1 Tax=Noccaea caerulescens TaxID=107243 RepID=A0A1J3IYH1_NOCCA
MRVSVHCDGASAVLGSACAGIDRASAPSCLPDECARAGSPARAQCFTSVLVGGGRESSCGELRRVRPSAVPS